VCLRVCLQAHGPLKKLSLCGSYIIIEESILQQLSLFPGLADTCLEPATTQAWFSSPIMCSLSYDKEKNTLKSIEIQRGLHAISILIIILFLLMTLKPMMVGPFDQPSLESAMILAWFNPPIPCSLSNDKEKNASESIEIQRGLHAINILVILFILTTLKLTCFTYLSQSGVSTKQLAMQHLYWHGGQCIFGANHRKHYTVCAHECYYSLFTCQFLRSLCSFLSKSFVHCWPRLSDASWKSPPKPILFNVYCHGIDVIYIACMYCIDCTRPTQPQ
jgi:hypothetical protein